MTHCERILELLSDGQPHSHLELYGLFTVAHSRISDLRRQGHQIECWREGELYLYRLVSSLGAAVPPHPSPGNADNGSGRQRLEPTAAPSDATGQLVMV